MNKKSTLASAAILFTATTVSAFDIVSCQFIGVEQYCMQPNSWFGEINPRPTDPENAPVSYTSCVSTRWDGDNVVLCTNGANRVEFDADPDDQDDISRMLRTASYTRPENTGLGDVTSCIFRGRDQYCTNAAGQVGEIDPRPTDSSNAPTQYTSCFRSDDEIYCKDGSVVVQFDIENDDDDWRYAQTTVVATTTTTAAPSSAAAGSTASVPLSTRATTTTSAITTATARNNNPGTLTSCHFHGVTQYCENAAGLEGYIKPQPTDSANAPSSYTDCRYEDQDDDDYDIDEDLVCTVSGGTVVTFEVDDDDDYHRTTSRGRTTNTETISSSTTALARASNTPGSLTSCHFHGATQYCFNEAGLEGPIHPRPTNTADAPTSYKTCRFEDSDDNEDNDEDLICTQDGIIVTFDVDEDDQRRLTREHAEVGSSVTSTTGAASSVTATSFLTSVASSSAPAATTTENTSNAAALNQVAHSFALVGGAILMLF